MIPAKITNLDPPQVTGYRLPEPDPFDYMDFYSGRVEDYIGDKYETDMEVYEASKFIADVENVEEYTFNDDRYSEWYAEFDDGSDIKLSLNQPCQIELTGEGKAKIVKL